MVQLDPMKTILVVSHSHNTFDKKSCWNQAVWFVEPTYDWVTLFKTKRV
jgi:hypothetical protein